MTPPVLRHTRMVEIADLLALAHPNDTEWTECTWPEVFEALWDKDFKPLYKTLRSLARGYRHPVTVVVDAATGEVLKGHKTITAHAALHRRLTVHFCTPDCPQNGNHQ